MQLHDHLSHNHDNVMNSSHSLRVFSILIFSAFLCPMAAGQNNDDSYFPLRIGNEWIFQDEYSSSYSEMITDTIGVNGHRYYGFTVMDIAPYEWFRESNDSIYMVNVTLPIDTTKDLIEFLLYTFADSIGTTWSLPNGYGATYGSAITISDTSVTITTSAGIFHNCRTFWHTTGARDAGYINSWFARGIGRVKYTEESYGGMRTFSLKSYTVVTDMKSIFTAPMITTYLLMENYPNPFNPSTTIQYYIPEKAYVTLRVIDLLGREISVLVNEVKHPGTYETLWDASGWPSGVYFAVLNTNNRSTTTKLILLK